MSIWFIKYIECMFLGFLAPREALLNTYNNNAICVLIQFAYNNNVICLLIQCAYNDSAICVLAQYTYNNNAIHIRI
jgi:hypothetical protein